MKEMERLSQLQAIDLIKKTLKHASAQHMREGQTIN